MDALPIYNMERDGIALGPLDRRFLDDYLRWVNDFETALTYADIALPVPRKNREAWVERSAEGTDRSIVRFTIFERTTGRPLGLTNLHAIDVHHRTAEFGLLIGDREQRGRGHGTTVTRMMLDYAFDRLELHNVMLRVYGNNEAGIRAYQKAGFREFGRRSQSRLLFGQRHDEIFMECVRDRP